MSILSEIFDNIKQSFQYWKPRERTKALGDKFEEWVVLHSNCCKNCSDNNYWNFLFWSSDKYVEVKEKNTTKRYYPDSNFYPDLVFRTNPIHPYNERKKLRTIAVECKYSSKCSVFITDKQLERYTQFIKKYEIDDFYFVFGFGNKSLFSDVPKDVFIVRGDVILEKQLVFWTTVQGKDYWAVSLDALKQNTETKGIHLEKSNYNLMYWDDIRVVHYIP